MPSDSYIFQAESKSSPKHAEQQRLAHLNTVYNPITLAVLKTYIKLGMRVLEIGPGNGEIAAELTKHIGPGGRYVGVDRDADVITPLKEKFKGNPAMRWLVSDLRDIHTHLPDEKFDLIFCRWVFSHIPTPEQKSALEKAYALLAPKGQFICEDCDMYAARLVSLEEKEEGPHHAQYTEALDQWKKMASTIEKRQSLNFGLTAETLAGKLALPGYSVIAVKQFQGLLEGENKNALPLVMTVMRTFLIESGIMTEKKVDRLQTNLTKLAQNPNYAVAFVNDTIAVAKCYQI